MKKLSNKILKYIQQYLLLLIMLFMGNFSFGQINTEELLPSEKAFSAQATNLGNSLVVEFDIASGYYLYKDKITFKTDPANLLTEPQHGSTSIKSDPYFGEQAVYSKTAQITIPFSETQKSQQAPFTLVVDYQGCNEAGVCYPPSQANFYINASGVFKPEEQNKDSHSFFSSEKTQPSEHTTNNIEQHLGWTSLFAFFVAGIALSFTACMYPLLPILSSIIVGSSNKTLNKRKGFILSLVYIQGLALTYTLVGIVTALTGSLLTVWMQQPAVVLTASVLMVVLALGMFDIIQIQVPASIQQYFTTKSQKISGGKIGSVFIMGAFSALIVGPCVAPPLAVALGFIGQTQNALLGGSLLYMMALGMGLPLLVIGTLGAQIMPKSGEWMNTIKHFFGVIILGLAIYLASAFLPNWLSISLYNLLAFFVLAAILYKIYIYKTIKIRLFLISSFILLLSLTAYFTLNSLQQNNTMIHQALKLHFNQGSIGQKFSDVEKLKEAITNAQTQHPNKPVILDFYADWCVSCKEMEASTFSDSEVKKILSEEYQLIQADLTQTKPEHQNLLKEYNLFGPPAIFILYSDKNRSEPLIGFADKAEFLHWLSTN